ncbi:ketopantoate hydroxymethyltransferase [Piromyces finnis]|uniref:3-methyl-2-oxobutanoate hydroxymethyltransferase n=1 Tax=Piromyces finnis TaxID=1754191 RepID=A0A1Y1VJM4_9FUNG|nr:ketopantoate hydroxymethyltransferase [Piromyces finnis]|eukprot:ORX57262.1 ketopantoate hydroxymethyltransferase [Piromyces finnis]
MCFHFRYNIFFFFCVIGRKKVTLNTLNNLYKKGEPITMLTAHDYPSGLFVEKGGVDTCLVGDSLGMVTLGYNSTNPVTMDDMIRHCQAVCRGAKSPFIVCDMPFGSYEASIEDAVRNAVRLIAEGNAEAVKLEGGKEMAETIKAITKVGIPVLGHIGLTPQRQSSLGGFRVQGKTMKDAKYLLEDALALQEAGCYGIVLEAMPKEVASFITSQLNILTIGIGAGNGCSGQVLVQQDMLGAFDKFVPKFCKVYADISSIAVNAVKNYTADVKSRKFPDDEKNCYKMKSGEDKKLQEYINSLKK